MPGLTEMTLTATPRFLPFPRSGRTGQQHFSNPAAHAFAGGHQSWAGKALHSHYFGQSGRSRFGRRGRVKG